MALSESREASSFPRKDYYTNFPINHMRPTGPTREAWGVRLSGFAPVEAV
jgi:hypothetical protein